MQLIKGRIKQRTCRCKEGPNAIKRAFAGLPDLNQCEEIIDYGNVEHNHELLIDTQREFADLAAKSIKRHKQTFYLVAVMI